MVDYPAGPRRGGDGREAGRRDSEILRIQSVSAATRHDARSTPPVQLLVAVTIQPSTQTSIGFESQEDRAHPVIRHHGHVRTLTDTEASRQFSTLLDSIEAGNVVVVTQGNRPIADISPVTRRIGRDLRTALEEIPPPDEKFIADVAEAVNFVTPARTDPREDTQS